MKKRKKYLLIPLVVLLALLAGFFIYVSDYYRADASASAAFVSDEQVTVTALTHVTFFDGPGEGDALIFYPGGKVDENAYGPLLHQLAGQGVDVFLVAMPCRLAILGVDRADDSISSYRYDRWFIGGHSLGGAAAAMYAADHPELSGTILLAAYPTRQLDKEDLQLVIYGSQDGVLNFEKLSGSHQYASDNYLEYRLEGGNHCQFGDYGFQKGDGQPEMTRQQQQQLTVQYIIDALRQ